MPARSSNRADWRTRFLTRMPTAGRPWVKQPTMRLPRVRLTRARRPAQPPSTGNQRSRAAGGRRESAPAGGADQPRALAGHCQVGQKGTLSGHRLSGVWRAAPIIQFRAGCGLPRNAPLGVQNGGSARAYEIQGRSHSVRPGSPTWRFRSLNTSACRCLWWRREGEHRSIIQAPRGVRAARPEVRHRWRGGTPRPCRCPAGGCLADELGG